jgi:predicted AAA+ superfamily ATPase
MYYNRILEDTLVKLSAQFPAFLVTGPRQVGKTTLLKYLGSDHRTYLSLDDISLRELAKEDPKLFLQQYTPPLIIDEIQYATELLPYIKIEIDKKKRNGAYWITGSQHYQMMKGVTESLAGRIAIINLLGLSQKERRQEAKKSSAFLPDFRQHINYHAESSIQEIYHHIWRGSMPALIVDESIDWNVFYNSYLQTYLQRDVRDLTQVGDLRQFTRFLKACAARTGQLVNYSDLASDTDISVSTAKQWLSILEASLQITLLQPYSSNVTNRLVKTPKLYFNDTGLCAFLTGWTSPETLMNGAMAGAIFETFVLVEIIKSWMYQGKYPGLYFYRDRDGNEIDLILEYNNILYPIEIKRSSSVRRDWGRSFRRLKRLPKTMGTGTIICLTDQSLMVSDSIQAIPVELIS